MPKALQDKISAKAWTDKVLAAIGGKGGGAEARAQGQATDPSLLDKALAEAKSFTPSGGGKAAKKDAAPNEGKKKGKKDGGKEEATEEKKDPEAERKALLKKVIKEGGKRGVEIEGAADMGGLQFFSTSVDCPNGDEQLLVECLKAMNNQPEPGDEERKGCSGHVGKMIFSAGDNQLALVAYVPGEKQELLSCQAWLEEVLKSQPGGKLVSSSKDICVGVVPKDGDKNIFPLKIREPMLFTANDILRKKGLFPENDSDDDDYVFGDDDFPS